MSALAANPSQMPAAAQTRSRARTEKISRAGWLFLSVFFIVVFEGAIRKWITSASSLPLIGLRDLLALGLVLHAWTGGYFKHYRKVVAAMFAWSLLVTGWGLFQLVADQSAPLILVIGLRFWLLYLWFGVAAACTLTQKDFRAAIYLAAGVMVVMAPLAVLQHYSPPGARINTQVDGTEESVFTAVAGVVRTTGTFSFTSGYAAYLGLIAPLVLGMLGARKRNSRNMLIALAVFGAFAIGTLVSGSRTAIITSGGFFFLYLVGRLVFSKMKKKPAAFAAVVVSLVLVGLAALVFQDAIEVTQTRFQQAADSENFLERLMVVFFGEPYLYESVGWVGYGVGFGSNLATYVRTGSAEIFGLAESEGGRILMEGGLLGFAYVAVKVTVVVMGLYKGMRLSFRTNSPFPFMVWVMAMLGIITWPSSGQLTANAFLGLIMAYALLIVRYPDFEFFPAKPNKS